MGYESISNDEIDNNVQENDILECLINFLSLFLNY